jgi:hypothetical protein
MKFSMAAQEKCDPLAQVTVELISFKAPSRNFNRVPMV